MGEPAPPHHTPNVQTLDPIAFRQAQLRLAFGQSKVQTIGVASLVATVLFLMALVVMSVVGFSVPCNSRFLVTALISLGVAMGVSLIGGNASARGHLPIPGLADKPLAISLGGGAAVLVIMFVLQSFLYSERDCSGADFSCDDALQISLLISDVERRVSTYERLCRRPDDGTDYILRNAKLATQGEEALRVVEAVETGSTEQDLRRALDAYNSAPKKGYVYYETDAEKQPTEDGRLVPVTGDSLMIGDVKEGVVLEALSTVRIREAATANSKIIGTVGADTCIRVTGPPVNLQPAANGGWLPFVSVSCPP